VAVLVRRAEAKGEKAKTPRLVVAAAYPDGAAVKVGTEVPLDTGEIGFAAESQIVVNRQDLQTDTTLAGSSRARPSPASPSPTSSPPSCSTRTRSA
jgi:hypothetical protein